MTIKLIWITPEAQKVIAYCARVSNPINQDNENIDGLLRYCMKHDHWSVFEMASMCVEITTTRAISAQIIRHRSFSFQEFSQRYAETTNIHSTTIRRQDVKNRQNSIDDIPDNIQQWWAEAQENVNSTCLNLYEHALKLGVAKECARMLLPLATETKLYMSGTIRSWITYLMTRMEKSTQLEHRAIARGVYKILIAELPVIGEMLVTLHPEVFDES